MAYKPVNVPKREIEKVRTLYYTKTIENQIFIYDFSLDQC